MRLYSRDDIGLRILPDRVEEPLARRAWAIWRWMDIRSSPNAPVYLRRLYILRSPWCQIMLHRILRPDPDRHLHDHPWDFLSIILRGWYNEQRSWFRFHRRQWWNFSRAEGCHKITKVSPDCLTLVFTGRRRRAWGFHTAKGWIHWKEYLYDHPPM